MVDIHTIPHESTKPPPVTGTGATTHPSVTRVYDNPPLNERRSPLTSSTPLISLLSTVQGRDITIANITYTDWRDLSPEQQKIVQDAISKMTEERREMTGDDGRGGEEEGE
jgi:hypothetical protein